MENRISKTKSKVIAVGIVLIIILILLLSFISCNSKISKIKEYNKTPLTKLTYKTVSYFGGGVNICIFDFENNIAIEHYFNDEYKEYDRTEIIAEFTDEQEKILINKLYSYGLFDIKDEYNSPPGTLDGSGWDLVIEYNDGTIKKSSGSNNQPDSVFINCAKAFYDICGLGIIAGVPKEYYTPPTISYNFSYKNNNNPITDRIHSYVKRGNYKWNGFEESNIDIFKLTQDVKFPYNPNEISDYKFSINTSGYNLYVYEDYEKFKKCEIFSFDYNEQLTGKKKIVKKGWFKRIEFYVEFNKIYLVKLTFKNGDFVEYVFNTNIE